MMNILGFFWGGGRQNHRRHKPSICVLRRSCLQSVDPTVQAFWFSFRWPELYFKVRKVLGSVEGMQSEGYLADTQNTSLYLVRCQRAGWLSRRSEVAQSMTNVTAEACISCS